MPDLVECLLKVELVLRHLLKPSWMWLVECAWCYLNWNGSIIRMSDFRMWDRMTSRRVANILIIELRRLVGASWVFEVWGWR